MRLQQHCLLTANSGEIATTLKPVRRVVTGHNEAGRAIIQSDAPPTRVQVIGGGNGPTFDLGDWKPLLRRAVQAFGRSMRLDQIDIRRYPRVRNRGTASSCTY